MARFYLDLHQRGDHTADNDGVDAVDLTAARALAVSAARDIMCGDMCDGAICLSDRIEIYDADRVSVGQVRFQDAVTISGL